MGEMLNEVRAYIAALPEEQKAAQAVRCPRCESAGTPNRGRRTGLFFSVHIGNCGGETLIGEDPKELQQRWLSQFSKVEKV